MLKIGVKRKFFSGYEIYEAKEFYFRSFIESKASDDVGIEIPLTTPWLVIVLGDGSKVVVTDVEKRGYKIFAGGQNA
jgi:hypothetical protein